MRTFYQLVVMGVSAAIALTSPGQASTQAQENPPPQPQTSALVEGQRLPNQLAQDGTSDSPLPPLKPESPLPPPPPLPPPTAEPEITPDPGPDPAQRTSPPAPTPPTPDTPDQVPEELQRLNPELDLLELPNSPEAVQVEFTEPLTLQQALDLSQRNNRELQVTELELRRSQAALREARAALYPNVGTQADLSRTQSASAQLAIRERGGSDAGLPPEFVQQSQGDATSNNLTGTVELNYNVYTAGRRSATIRAAQEQVRFNELEVERLREQLRLDTTNNYYDIQEAAEQIRIAQAAVENAQISLRDAQALERAGLGTRFDVLRAQVQLANATQDLTQALSRQRIAQRRLAQQLSLPPNANLNAGDPVAVADRWTPTLEETIIQAFENRAELAQQLAQRNISRARRRVALAEYGPQVSIFANYNVLESFDDNLGPEDGYAIGARVGLTLFDGGAARARAAQEEANIAIAETQFANTRDQVRFQVEEAYNELRANFENIQTAAVAVEQAEESLRLARLRFQAGVGTQLDVTNAETELTEAQSNRLQAILNYNRALAALERAVSILPPRQSPSQAM